MFVMTGKEKSLTSIDKGLTGKETSLSFVENSLTD